MEFSELFYIDSTGYHTSDYDTVLAWLKQKYRDIYGQDVYLEPDSQDGQWIAVQAKALYDAGMLGQSVYNSFSPLSAQGTGLSRNVQINGIDRRVATRSTVDLLIVGQAGTTLTGAIAIDVLEQKWNIPDGTVIPPDGDITVTAEADVEGAVTAVENTVNRIFTPTLGWQSVNNPTAASVGAPVETDAELRIRQSTSTANPSLTVLEGSLGAVLDVDGVTKARAYENDTDDPDANGIPGHTICLVVEGGDATEICTAIQIHKTPGVDTFGDTEEIIYDSHGMPLPIRFQRPDPVTIKVELDISVGIGWSSDFVALIQEAVAAYINEIGIGNNVLITKLFIPAYLLGTQAAGTFDIVTLEIAIDGDPLAGDNIDIDFDQLPVCIGADDVTVNVT